jgi:carbamoyl-phosphate synthase small subunit
MSTFKPAVLALEDGSVFRGRAFGADATIAGECVFNTSMTGYQEIITDPSYYGQIVTMTAPMIGNYGINDEDTEASVPRASGLVVRELSPIVSNWRSQSSLDAYLRKYGIPGISEVDTRALTKKLRVDGAMKCCLSTLALTDAEAVARAKAWHDMAGSDYVKDTTCKEPYLWRADDAANHNAVYVPAGTTFGLPHTPAKRFTIAAFDFGAKHSIFRKLVNHGFDVKVFPATASAEQIKEHAPDGVFLSNGPGDPEPCVYAIEAIRQILEAQIPVFGICLGHQLLGLASGAKTLKMKFGHHGANHPVLEIATGRVLITSQNHGFAIDEATLPPSVRATHRSLFDGSLQGIERTDCLAFSVQGHPEASPGPHDLMPLFDRFITNMSSVRH